MSAAARLKYLHLAYFSKPVADRVIYRAIAKLRPRSIVEIGMGTALRAQRMIAVAARYRPQDRIHYTGIDLFEAGHGGLSLKSAYRDLMASGGRIKLVPGDPFSALAQVANSLSVTDLLVIGGGHDGPSLERAWFYVPRMLGGDARVYVQRSEATRFELFSAVDVERLAACHDLLSHRRVA